MKKAGTLHRKVRISKSFFLVPVLLLFLCLNFTQPVFAANVLGRPRKMFLVKTEHFDIIYSNLSEETALLLVQNADALYEKAAEALGAENNLHMPVIISPDSDELSVTYTESPYNRIIIFDSPVYLYTTRKNLLTLCTFHRAAYKRHVRANHGQRLAHY